MEFSTTVERLDSHVLLTATGDIDLATAPKFRDAGLEAIGVEPATVIVDLTRVSFMDSTALGVLVLLRRKSRARRGELRVVSGRKTRAIFKIAGLDQVFDVYPDLASALGEADDNDIA